ncbi:sensor histidine kinase [Paenibacillus tarimensis]|uniref:sensor histidine kinase n=1 Tax=Paenibacillus tarimensis TaxID=416012 RepID=UPI001F2F41F7|nr:sensor histidine kinase [Paenibacillus tarimensis]MCF2945405.1 sensor histidine kinase [Paenibacillus tarimensis]
MNIRTYFGNQLIKNKIFLFTLMIMIVVSGVSIIAVQVATVIYEDRIYSESAQVLNLSSGSIDNQLRRIEDLTFRMISDKTVQRYLIESKRDQNAYERFKTKDVLMERLLDQSRQERPVASVQMNDALGGELQMSVTSRYRIDTTEAVRLAREAGGSVVWVPSSEPNVLLAAREVRQMQDLSLEHLGTLILYLDMNRLVDTTLDLTGDRMFMIEYAGQHLLSTNPEKTDALLGQPLTERQGYRIGTLDGQAYFITHLTSKYQNFTYYNILPYGSIFNQSKMIKYGLLGLYGLLFLIAIYLGRLAGRTISRPLERLTDKMKLVQKGHIDPAELFQDNNLNADETGQLHRHFRLMLETINELIRENYAKQLAINESEYKALQAQINPHFLYNTLESINWMAKVNKQQDISTMVQALGSLLRSIIGKKEPLITIEEEMNILHHYITIQQMRFGERLVFRCSDDPLLTEYYIPKLTIQPVVENTIQHGLEAMSGVCTIDLTFLAEEEHIEIIIRDNGPGIDEETLGAIAEGRVVSKGTGIGLANIRDRISLLFGPAYGVTVESTPGEGTTVRIRIPYSLEGEHV